VELESRALRHRSLIIHTVVTHPACGAGRTDTNQPTGYRTPAHKLARMAWADLNKERNFEFLRTSVPSLRSRMNRTATTGTRGRASLRRRRCWWKTTGVEPIAVAGELSRR
jgi:hypothetical protein